MSLDIFTDLGAMSDPAGTWPQGRKKIENYLAFGSGSKATDSEKRL